VDEYPSIGNLILVSEELNARLKNKSFVEKKRILRRAGVPLDSTIEGAYEWGREQILQRTQALAELIYNSET
jgi:hypothetical protein